MPNKFLNIKKNKNCSNCVYGETSTYSDEVFCKKHGVCDKRDYCHSFKYDVLKREPSKQIADKNFTKDDFSL